MAAATLPDGVAQAAQLIEAARAVVLKARVDMLKMSEQERIRLAGQDSPEGWAFYRLLNVSEHLSEAAGELQTAMSDNPRGKA